MAITTSETTFTSRDGRTLFRRSWLPADSPRAAIAIVHGYAEHSGRYAWTGEQLANAGFAVHAYDLRGHGQSDGTPVLVRSFKEHLDDLDSFLGLLRREHPGTHLFLLGHSMGGLIATLYCAVRPRELAGLVTSGPAIAPPPRALKAMTGVVRLVAAFRPGAGVLKLPAAGVSRDAAVVAAYERDRLVFHGKMPAGSLAAFGRAIARVHKDMHTISLPLLALHGTADRLTSPAGSQALYDGVQSRDRTLKLYQGLAHEVLNEPERGDVVADLREWLEARS